MKTITAEADPEFSEDVPFPEDHKDKRTAASIETAAKKTLNNTKNLKNEIDGPVMKETENATLLSSSDAPSDNYVMASDGVGGWNWRLLQPVINGIEDGEELYNPDAEGLHYIDGLTYQ